MLRVVPLRTVNFHLPSSLTLTLGPTHPRVLSSTLGRCSCFSTSARAHQQQLFVPYATPPTQRQKKRERKEEMKGAPRLNHRLTGDIQRHIARVTRTNVQVKIYTDARKAVERLIEEAGQGRFKVVDCGMATWGKSLYNAPLELVLVDKEHPNGLGPDVDRSTLPDLYDPDHLAALLASAGYTGAYSDPEADVLYKAIWSGPHLLRLESTLAPETSYTSARLPKREFVRTPIWTGRAPNEGQRLTIRCPDPAVQHTRDVLEAFGRTWDEKAFADTVAVCYDWLRKQALTEFTPTCVGLLVMAVWQQRYTTAGWIFTVGDSARTVKGQKDKVLRASGNEVERQKQELQMAINAQQTGGEEPEPQTASASGSSSKTQTSKKVKEPEHSATVWMPFEYGKRATVSPRGSPSPRSASPKPKLTGRRSTGFNRSRGSSGDVNVEVEWEQEPMRIDVRYQEHRTKMAVRKLSSYFLHFLIFISNIDVMKQRVWNVARGGEDPHIREFVHHRPVTVTREGRRDLYSREKVLGTAYSPEQQPKAWTLHTMVVQDPFVPTHNHAANIPRPVLTRLYELATSAAAILGRGHPLCVIMEAPGSQALIADGERSDADVELAAEAQEALYSDPDIANMWRPRGAQRESGPSEPPPPISREEYEKASVEIGRRTRELRATRYAPARGDLETFGTAGAQRPWRDAPPATSRSSFTLERPSVPYRPRMHGEKRYHTSATLRQEATELYESARIPPEVHRNRAVTIRRVQDVVKRRFSDSYNVELFGSVRYGVDSVNSDLDLVIMDPKYPDGFRPDVLRSEMGAIYQVGRLAGQLRRAGFVDVQPIASASVPIVKFRDPRTDLHCDINVNDRLGIINTDLIKRYVHMCPVLKPMLLCIKRWAKPIGLNEPSGRSGGPTSFSSYALTLMTLGLFQVRGYLPNLQKGFPPLANYDKPGTVFWLRSKTDERIPCDIRHAKPWISPESARTDIALDEVLTDWFEYWGYRHDYRKDVMSIRHGGLVPRSHVFDPTGKDSAERKAREVALAAVIQKVDEEEDTTGFGLKQNDPITEDKLQEARTARLIEQLAELVHQADISRWKSEDEKAATAAVASAVEPESNAEFSDATSLNTSNVPPAGTEQLSDESEQNSEVGDPKDLDDISQEDTNAVAEGGQPGSWEKAALVVADPFIETKNVASAIRQETIERFIAECRRVVEMLRQGNTLQEIIDTDTRDSAEEAEFEKARQKRLEKAAKRRQRRREAPNRAQPMSNAQPAVASGSNAAPA